MLTPNATPLPPPIARIFVEEALESGHRAGIDLPRLMADLNLSDRALDGFTPAEFGRIWLELSRRMEDEFFGLGLSPMRPGSTTLLGHAIRQAPEFETALRRALRFLRVVLGEPYGVLDTDGATCVVRLQESDSRSAFAYRTFFLILHGFNCWLLGERMPLKAIAFPCRAPLGVNDYGEFFGVPVRFDAADARISFDARYLRRPIHHSDAELKRFLRTLPEAFLRGYRDTVGIKSRIISACLQGPAAEWPGAEAIAARLGLSRSGLHRRLSAVGQSLSQIKDEQRRNRATRLLRTTDRDMADIAAEVGYAESSAFYRAFARWYGTTPALMRKSMAQGGLTR